MKFQNLIFIALSLIPLSACKSIPDGITPVDGIELEKYMGTWYEIHRLDMRFEKNLVDVTATYTMLDNGEISVLNRGFDTVKNQWNDIEGKARTASADNNAMLEVSFFGPFYSGYNVLAIDKENYDYALVCGASREYLWVLARNPTLNKGIVDDLLAKAEEMGFETNKLVDVPHSRANKPTQVE